MKLFKQIFMLAIIAGAMVLTSCNDDSVATISVKVVKNGKAVVGEQVYMYRGSLQDSFLETKVHASKNIATDDEGVAEFGIRSIDFGVGSDQATVIFETFDADENVNGKIAASVRKGDKKTVTLYMN